MAMARRLSMRPWLWPCDVFAQDAGHYADAEDDEGEADEPLGPVIQPLGQAHVQLKNGDAKRSHGECMAQGIGHA